MNKLAAILFAASVAGAAAATNTSPAAPASTAAAPSPAGPTFFDQYGSLIITSVILAAIFAFMWHKGYLARMRDYVAETQEELKKCTWPTVDELKGSTVVVMVTITLIGVFTVGVDAILMALMRAIM